MVTYIKWVCSMRVVAGPVVVYLRSLRKHWEKFLRIALPLNATHLQGENAAVLCTGLRNIRIKLGEKIRRQRTASNNQFMLGVIATRA